MTSETSYDPCLHQGFYLFLTLTIMLDVSFTQEGRQIRETHRCNVYPFHLCIILRHKYTQYGFIRVTCECLGSLLDTSLGANSVVRPVSRGKGSDDFNDSQYLAPVTHSGVPPGSDPSRPFDRSGLVPYSRSEGSSVRITVRGAFERPFLPSSPSRDVSTSLGQWGFRPVGHRLWSGRGRPRRTVHHGSPEDTRKRTRQEGGREGRGE